MRERAAERQAELDVIADAPDDVRPWLLVCPNCQETEPHTRVRFGGPWLLVCWGCSHTRGETQPARVRSARWCERDRLAVRPAQIDQTITLLRELVGPDARGRQPPRARATTEGIGSQGADEAALPRPGRCARPRCSRPSSPGGI